MLNVKKCVFKCVNKRSCKYDYGPERECASVIYLPPGAPKSCGSRPRGIGGGLRSRPALLEGRASDFYHLNQQVIIEFCQRERSSKLRGLPMSVAGLVSRVTPVHTALRNCTRDEGRSFEFGNQVSISSHRKLLSSKAMVVSVAETAGHDPVRQG